MEKQAVPLVFLEITTRSIVNENGKMPAIARIGNRVERWLDEAWKPLRGKQGRIDDMQAQRITAQAAARIQERLREFWRGGVKTVSELPNAMLVIAEDTLATMPRNNAERRKAWALLIKALYDPCLVADPELRDNEAQERGLRIAEMVMKEAA